MAIERWGTLSVKDHLDSQALIADLLLYDRLVFPVMSGYGERTRWRNEQWDPDLQESVIEELGEETVVKAYWDKARQEQYQDIRQMRKAIGEDAFQTTRWILAMDRQLPIPDNAEVRAIAAYHDLDEGRKDLGLETPQPDEVALGKLAFVVGQRLLVPKITANGDSRDLMLRARDLCRERSYAEQRQEFYVWQESTVDAIVRRRRTVNGAVGELSERADRLNRSIRTYFEDNRVSLTVKTALTVIGIFLPPALGLHEAAGLIGIAPPAFELVKFGAEQIMEPMTKEKCEASAMIVSASKMLAKG